MTNHDPAPEPEPSPLPFHYRPECDAVGCQSEPTYKLAASWTNGTSRELKSYGVVCPDHLTRLLVRARASRAALVVTEGEYVGEVGVYRLEPGRLDTELTPIADSVVPTTDPISSGDP